MGWVVNATLRPLYPREGSGTPCIRGWVGPWAGLDGCGKISPPTGIRSPDRPVSVASRYTDCTIPTHGRMINDLLIFKMCSKWSWPEIIPAETRGSRKT